MNFPLFLRGCTTCVALLLVATIPAGYAETVDSSAVPTAPSSIPASPSSAPVDATAAETAVDAGTSENGANTVRTSADPVPAIPNGVKFDPHVLDTQLIAPTAPNWNVPARSFDPRRFILPPPPKNESAQTKREIRELNALAATRTDPNVIANINRWNDDPPGQYYNLFFDNLAQTTRGFTPPLTARCYAMLNQGFYEGLIAAWYNKFTYLRPRPDQMTNFVFTPDPAIFTGGAGGRPDYTGKVTSPPHPAYPSGHSTSAGVFMAIGPSCFPDTPVESFVALGREASIARRQGGVHYYSDSVAGEALGYAVGSAIVSDYSRDGSPLGGATAQSTYTRIGGTGGGAIRAALNPRPTVTVTTGPQVGPDGKIQLVPIKPFPAPPQVKLPPDPIIVIPRAR
jgi:membrane-associated phospholipid phosphatase